MQRPGSRDVREAVLDSALLAAASLASYWLVADVLSRLYPSPRTEHIIGGLWATIATIFVATAAITTAVLLALAMLNPHHAWQQPILPLGDTVVGVIVGVAAAWLGRGLTGQPTSSDS